MNFLNSSKKCTYKILELLTILGFVISVPKMFLNRLEETDLEMGEKIILIACYGLGLVLVSLFHFCKYERDNWTLLLSFIPFGAVVSFMGLSYSWGNTFSNADCLFAFMGHILSLFTYCSVNSIQEYIRMF